MTRIIKGVEVVRPDTKRLTSSVLDHAQAAGNVRDRADFGMSNAAGLWPSYNCLDLLVPTVICPPEDPDDRVAKTFGNAPWTEAFEFAVQGGVQCAALGLDREDQTSEVKRVFGLVEGKGIEQALVQNRFVAADPSFMPLAGVPVTWSDPTDLTPGVDIPLTVAVALLEGYAARNYAGQPTLHMPRAAATMLSSNGLIVWEGDLAYTKEGSKVAIGGGYDDPDMLASGEWDLYATGEVYVERSEQVDVNTFEMTGSEAFEANTMLSLVERMYRVAVDCFVVKVTGKVF